MQQGYFILPQMHELPQAAQVTRALRAVPGVVDVLASVTFHQLIVQYDDTLASTAMIRSLLTAMGFAPVMEELPTRRLDSDLAALSN